MVVQNCNWSPGQLWDLHLLRFPKLLLIQLMTTIVLQVEGWTRHSRDPFNPSFLQRMSTKRQPEKV